MRFLATLLTIAAAVSGVCVEAKAFTDAQYEYLFTKWVSQHNKVYPHDQFFTKFNTFKTNLDKIHHHNKGNSSFTLAMNQYGDMTSEEFKQNMLGFRGASHPYLRSKNAGSHHHHVEVDAAPNTVDWRSKGAVTPVKNQGQCGSCWAFSTTGSTEGAVFLASGTLPSLSEQQLMDCSGAQGNQGCNGGLMDSAFEWIISNKGITSESQDPYQGAASTCPTSATSVAAITGYTDVPTLNEQALLSAVAQQPVSIAIEADQAVFQFYSSGVIDDASCGTTLDHGVLIVGYGTDSTLGKDYWTVKNSWGASWGEQGYVRLVRGSNQCGLATQPSYPTGASSLSKKHHGKH
jgi:C1A family cysteine protease